MKRVVIYARANNNKKDNLLRNQISELRVYCEHRGYEIIREIKEYSSSNTVSNALLKVAADNEHIDALVVCDRKSLCKRSAESELYEKLLYELDIELECVE